MDETKHRGLGERVGLDWNDAYPERQAQFLSGILGFIAEGRWYRRTFTGWRQQSFQLDRGGISGNAALVYAAVGREIAIRNRPITKPAVLLSGGETTVTPHTKGGRGRRICITAAVAIDGLHICTLAAGTDGIDGAETNAGGICGRIDVRAVAVDWI